MQKDNSKNNASEQRRSHLTILQLMGVLALLGILGTWILHVITQS
jgi:hypothetical protein